MGQIQERIRQAILYVAWLTRDDDRFGSTKLNKALCRADFHSYFVHGQPTTGAKYWALEKGPTLAAMIPTLNEMEAAGQIRVLRAPPGEWAEQRVLPVSCDQPPVPLLSEQDRQELELAVERIRPLRAGQVSELSHFPGYDHAWAMGRKTTIPYDSVFWARQGELTEAEEQWAQKVAEREGSIRP